MKKILLTAIVALFAVTAASAQDKGNWALGPRMNIYTNTGDAVVGLGAFGRYSFTDNWRIEPSLMALLHSGCSIDISVDAQYVFHLGEGWSVYPQVGRRPEHRRRFRLRGSPQLGPFGRPEMAAHVRRLAQEPRSHQHRRGIQVLTIDA